MDHINDINPVGNEEGVGVAVENIVVERSIDDTAEEGVGEAVENIVVEHSIDDTANDIAENNVSETHNDEGNLPVDITSDIVENKVSESNDNGASPINTPFDTAVETSIDTSIDIAEGNGFKHGVDGSIITSTDTVENMVCKVSDDSPVKISKTQYVHERLNRDQPDSLFYDDISTDENFADASSSHISIHDELDEGYGRQVIDDTLSRSTFLNVMESLINCITEREERHAIEQAEIHKLLEEILKNQNELLGREKNTVQQIEITNLLKEILKNQRSSQASNLLKEKESQILNPADVKLKSAETSTTNKVNFLNASKMNEAESRDLHSVTQTHTHISPTITQTQSRVSPDISTQAQIQAAIYQFPFQTTDQYQPHIQLQKLNQIQVKDQLPVLRDKAQAAEAQSQARSQVQSQVHAHVQAQSQVQPKLDSLPLHFSFLPCCPDDPDVATVARLYTLLDLKSPIRDLDIYFKEVNSHLRSIRYDVVKRAYTQFAFGILKYFSQIGYICKNPTNNRLKPAFDEATNYEELGRKVNRVKSIHGSIVKHSNRDEGVNKSIPPSKNLKRSKNSESNRNSNRNSDRDSNKRPRIDNSYPPEEVGLTSGSLSPP